jgi:hypothetical protein
MAGEYFMDPQLAYRSATAKGKARVIRMLPEKMQDRFKELIEKIPIPNNPNAKDRFLDSLGGMADKSLRNAQMKMLKTHEVVPEDMLEEELEYALRLFSTLEPAIQFAYLSPKPLAYMEMLARSNYNVEEFMGSMNFFVDRKPAFVPLTAETLTISDELARAIIAKPPEAANNLLPLVRAQLPKLKGICLDDKNLDEKEKRYVEGMAMKAILYGFEGEHIRPMVDAEYQETHDGMSMRAQLRAAKIAMMGMGLAFEMMVNCGIFLLFENGSCVGSTGFERSFRHGMISAYVTTGDGLLIGKLKARGVRAGPNMLMLSEDPRIVQHELQHVFDGFAGIEEEKIGYEYRARLAEMAFTPDPGAAAEGIASALTILSRAYGKDKELDKEIIALTEVYRKVIIRAKNSDDLRWMSRKHLESAYLSAAKMSYDEILAPFAKKGWTD